MKSPARLLIPLALLLLAALALPSQAQDFKSGILVAEQTRAQTEAQWKKQREDERRRNAEQRADQSRIEGNLIPYPDPGKDYQAPPADSPRVALVAFMVDKAVQAKAVNPRLQQRLDQHNSYTLTVDSVTARLEPRANPSPSINAAKLANLLKLKSAEGLSVWRFEVTEGKLLVTKDIRWAQGPGAPPRQAALMGRLDDLKPGEVVLVSDISEGLDPKTGRNGKQEGKLQRYRPDDLVPASCPDALACIQTLALWKSLVGPAADAFTAERLPALDDALWSQAQGNLKALNAYAAYLPTGRHIQEVGPLAVSLLGAEMKGGKTFCQVVAELDLDPVLPEAMSQALLPKLPLDSIKAQAASAKTADEGYALVQCVGRVTNFDSKQTKSVASAWAGKRWPNSKIGSAEVAAGLCAAMPDSEWVEGLSNTLAAGQGKKGQCGELFLTLQQNFGNKTGIAYESETGPRYWLDFTRLDNKLLQERGAALRMVVRVTGQKSYKSPLGPRTVFSLEAIWVE